MFCCTTKEVFKKKYESCANFFTCFKRVSNVKYYSPYSTGFAEIQLQKGVF